MAEENDKDKEPKEPKEPKTPTPEEQAAILQAVFDKAFKKASEDFQKKLDAEKAERDKEKAERERIAAELEEVKKSVPKKKEKEEAQPDPVLEQLKNQMAEFQNQLRGVSTERDALADRLKKADEERRRNKKKDDFLNAARDAKVSFFDPLVAYELAEREGLDFDESGERVVVKNTTNGAVRVNERGDDMSVVEFVKEFAKKKNYLVKAENAGGTGAGPSEKAEQEKREYPDFNKMSAEDFQKYRDEVLQRPR